MSPAPEEPVPKILMTKLFECKQGHSLLYNFNAKTTFEKDGH
jgi:hypothetical protein